MTPSEVPANGGLSPEAVAHEVYGSHFESISQYVDILTNRGIEWGLLGPREQDRLWDRHILNSAAVASVIGPGERVADIGSGAGLPGLPLAILRPDLEVVLVESLLRRANFLELAVEELGLGDRVEVVRSRAEDWRSTVDTVTCRAVAPVPKLLSWTKHLWLPRGRLVALKGDSVPDEVDQASALWNACASLPRCSRCGPTPRPIPPPRSFCTAEARYPRRRWLLHWGHVPRRPGLSHWGLCSR